MQLNNFSRLIYSLHGLVLGSDGIRSVMRRQMLRLCGFNVVKHIWGLRPDEVHFRKQWPMWLSSDCYSPHGRLKTHLQSGDLSVNIGHAPQNIFLPQFLLISLSCQTDRKSVRECEKQFYFLRGVIIWNILQMKMETTLNTKGLGLQMVKPNPCMPHLQTQLSNIC